MKLTKPNLCCPAQRHQLRINVFLDTLNSSPICFHVRTTNQCNKSSGSFSVSISLWAHRWAQTSQFMMNYISGQWFLMLQLVKWEFGGVHDDTVQRDVGLVMTSAWGVVCFRVTCYRWCDKHETESGWQREAREHWVYSSIERWRLKPSNTLITNKRRSCEELWLVEHVVSTHVKHGSAPSDVCLMVLLLLDHHWKNTAT